MALLAHQLITAPGTSPPRWCLIAHGIFGRGQNWRTIARRLCERLPQWGAVLVDLRAHGKSVELDGPHTLAAAAADVVETIEALAPPHDNVRALVGHSFGGKVLLAARARLDLDVTWLIDSSPSRNPGAIIDPTATAPMALVALEEIAASRDGFADRGELVAALGERGMPPGVGHFLAMNLGRGADGRFRFTIDLAAIRSLLTDYFERDLWNELERGDRCPVAVAVASRQSALSPLDVSTMEALPGVVVHRVADAGHWIHADAPDVLLELLVDSLAGL